MKPAKKPKLKLKPCPFCGGDCEPRNIGREINYDYKPKAYIVCRDCRCRTMNHHTEVEAIKAWNTRKGRA